MSHLLVTSSDVSGTHTHTDFEPSVELSGSTGPSGHTSSCPKVLMQDGVNATIINTSMNSKFILCYLLLTTHKLSTL